MNPQGLLRRQLILDFLLERFQLLLSLLLFLLELLLFSLFLTQNIYHRDATKVRAPTCRRQVALTHLLLDLLLLAGIIGRWGGGPLQ